MSHYNSPYIPGIVSMWHGRLQSPLRRCHRSHTCSTLSLPEGAMRKPTPAYQRRRLAWSSPAVSAPLRRRAKNTGGTCARCRDARLLRRQERNTSISASAGKSILPKFLFAGNEKKGRKQKRHSLCGSGVLIVHLCRAYWRRIVSPI